MRFWFLLLSLLFIFIAPAVYLFADTLSVSNQVHITATVPSLDSEPSPSPTSTGSEGGGGSWTSQVTNVRDDEEEEGEGSTDENTAEDAVVPETGTGIEADAEPEDEIEESPTAQSGDKEADEPIKPEATNVYFGGYSFPNAIISYSLDGELIATIQADETGYFEGTYSSVEAGEQVFSFQAQSYEGDESNLVSYAYTVQAESPVYISGVVLSPILDISSGGTLEGVSIPGSELQVYGLNSMDQSQHVVDSIQVNPDGTYVLDFDLGEATVYDQYYVACKWKGIDCGFSDIIHVQMVGTSYKFVDEVPADFTKDIQVNFVDFGFIRAAFLLGKNNSIYDLNQDGAINLVDFSLLNYQWTL